jgi:uncharacterized protein (DUF779 family)
MSAAVTATSATTPKKMIKPLFYSDRSHPVGAHDVICGKKCEHHVGNRSFRQLVLELAPQYQTTSTRDTKKQIIGVIIDRVRARGGHFVKESDDLTTMELVPPRYIYEKVSHALRSARLVSSNSSTANSSSESSSLARQQQQQQNAQQRQQQDDLLATQQKLFYSYIIAASSSASTSCSDDTSNDSSEDDDDDNNSDDDDDHNTVSSSADTVPRLLVAADRKPRAVVQQQQRPSSSSFGSNSIIDQSTLDLLLALPYNEV